MDETVAGPSMVESNAAENPARLSMPGAAAKGARERVVASDALFRELVEVPSYWSYAQRAQLLSLSPLDLLQFLERDDVLIREDGRDLVIDLDSWCAGALTFEHERMQRLAEGREIKQGDPRLLSRVRKGLSESWCGSFARTPNVYARMQMLSSLVRSAGTTEQERYERLSEQVQAKAARGDDDLRALLAEDRADLVSVALHELWRRHDSGAVKDWLLLDALSYGEAMDTLALLRVRLECQHLGGCTVRDHPAVGAMCFNIPYHCDQGGHFDTIMRRGLSPAQFDALMMLMSSVEAYRRLHRA